MKTNKFLLGTFLCTLVMGFTACNTNEPGISTNDACSHAFKVSSSGKQVYFSKGNLQYQASTDTWRFAENQYDFIGGNDSWIDRFGWGTGNNPTLTSEDNKDYAFFKDWGMNSISNAKGNWRTLTRDEWEYIAQTTVNVPATVCGVEGCLLLPTDFELPADLSFETNVDNYKTNVYMQKQWLQLQKAGAVFLPTVAYWKSYHTCYWSSSQDPGWSSYAYALTFYRIGGTDIYPRSARLAVRLVQDVE